MRLRRRRDRPAPPQRTLPQPAPEPLTFEQMVRHVLVAAVNEGGMPPFDALMAARRGVRGLIEQGALREWGCTSAGQILYERAPHPVVPKEGPA